MPLDEISFYNVVGDEISPSNIVNQIIDFYERKIEIGETKITDFNEGSEIRNLIEAFSVAIYALLEEEYDITSIAFISTSYGVWLDKIGEMPFINLNRIEGSESQGYVTFTLNTVLETDFVIPNDTVLIASESGLEFITTMDCLIPSGELSSDVTVESLTTGYDTNVPASSIDTIDDDTIDSSLVTVTNPEMFDGGTDYEEDEDYRTRLLESVQKDGFGTVYYYEELGKSVSGVHDVKLIPDSKYTRKVLVNGNVKPTPDKILLDTLAEYSKTNNIVINHTFTVDKPSYQAVDLTLNLDVLGSISESELNLLMEKMFNGGSYYEIELDGLDIGESLNLETVVETFLNLGAISSITVQVTGDSEDTRIIEPENTNTVLKKGEITYNITEVQ